MFYKAVSVALVAVLLHGSIAAQTEPQSPSQTVAQMQQVLRKTQERDKAVKVILNKKIDNQKKFSGKVSDVSDAGFVLTDLKTGKSQKLAYSDVREVHQKGLSKGAKIGLGVFGGVVLFGVISAIVILAHGSE
jgi:hypothetical protein